MKQEAENGRERGVCRINEYNFIEIDEKKNMIDGKFVFAFEWDFCRESTWKILAHLF